MTLSELTDQIAESTGVSREDVTRVLRSFMENAKEVLETGESVKLTGFGTFYTIRGKERPLFRGDRMASTRQIIKFREKREKHMKEKRAVVLDEEKVKTGSKDKSCPSCGDPISDLYCMRCGTEPFEKRPEKK